MTHFLQHSGTRGVKAARIFAAYVWASVWEAKWPNFLQRNGKRCEPKQQKWLNFGSQRVQVGVTTEKRIQNDSKFIWNVDFNVEAKRWTTKTGRVPPSKQRNLWTIEYWISRKNESSCERRCSRPHRICWKHRIKRVDEISYWTFLMYLELNFLFKQLKYFCVSDFAKTRISFLPFLRVKLSECQNRFTKRRSSLFPVRSCVCATQRGQLQSPSTAGANVKIKTRNKEKLKVIEST